MRIFLAFFFIFAMTFAGQAEQTQSSVFTCVFTDDLTSQDSLRMKSYSDTSQNLKLGKVDLLRNSEILESLATKVYQIPLWDDHIYMQIWYANSLRVDAQMSMTGSNHHFLGVYSYGPLQRSIFCTSLN
jgi:hypothetical protein